MNKKQTLLIFETTSFLKIALLWGVLFIFLPMRAQQNCECGLLSKSSLEDFSQANDSAAVFSQIKKLQQTKTKNCIFESLDLAYNYYIKNNQTRQAWNILKRQQNLRLDQDCSSRYEYSINTNYAYYYHVTNNLEKLSFYAFKALRAAEKLEDSNKKIKAIQQIVYLFTKMNQHEKNWPYIQQAQKMIRQQPASATAARNYRWLAFEYEEKFNLTQRKTLLDSALAFANQSKAIAFRFGMYDEIANLYRVKESCAYHQGDVKHALIYIDSAIFFGKKIKGFKNLSALYSAKAWDHLDSGQAQQAIKWMDTALNMARGLKDSSGRMMLLMDASNLYKEAGEPAKALQAFKVYTQMKDSVWNIEKVAKINELEQKYNKAKNERTIFELEKTQQRYVFLIFGGLLVLLSLVFFFRQRHLSQRQKIMDTEQRLNRARINPHFFFNALASLQRVSLAEKSPETTLFIARFAKIMRQSLESTYQELVTIEDEITFMTNYLDLQQLRFPDKFDYHFELPASLEIQELKIPGMLLQPFIENAIEHGFKDLEYKGKIEIIFEDHAEAITITVKDNGKGPGEKVVDKSHTSRAMQIVKDRLDLFNRQHRSEAFYKTLTPQGAGFAILISLPKIDSDENTDYR